MKLNQKFFLISFILMMILILLLGVFMIQYTFNKNLEREKQNSIFVYHNILNSVYSKLKSKDSTSSYYDDSLSVQAQELSEIVASVFTSYETSKTPIHIFLYQNYNLLCSNYYELPNELLNTIYPNDLTLHTYITKLNNEYTLFTYSQITVAKKTYLLISSTSLEDIYTIKQEQSSKFSSIGIILSLIISIILYIFSYLITKKIAAINIAAKKLSLGNYDARIPTVTGNDEVNALVNSFNTMASSIESYIQQISEDAESKQNFIDNLLHELRTPITNIKLSSTLLSTGIISIENEEKYADKLMQINEEIDYIHNITLKLIDLFLLRIDIKNLNEINLSKLIYNICKKQKKLYRKRNIKLYTKITPNVFKKVDVDLMKSLLLNILNNSFKSYPPNYQGIIQVFLSNTCLKVVDYGKGIPKEELNKIMQPFYTLDKSRNKEFGGIGLRCSFM